MGAWTNSKKPQAAIKASFLTSAASLMMWLPFTAHAEHDLPQERGSIEQIRCSIPLVTRSEAHQLLQQLLGKEDLK